MPKKYRKKFFSVDFVEGECETDSIELESDLDHLSEKGDYNICDSIMKWFERRGVIAGNPE